MKKSIRIILILVFGAVFVFSLFQVVSISRNYSQAVDTYDELRNNRTFDSSQNTPDSHNSLNWPQVDFDALKKINPDIVGWVYIDGTNIDYPIVQGDDDDFYLNHMFDLTPNKSGAIFLESKNSADFTDKNTIIYGHNMKNNSMFAQLMDYKEQKFYDEHRKILIVTPERRYVAVIFAGYVAETDYDSWKISFKDDKEFSDWVDYNIKKSAFFSTLMPESKDKILTLSTCSYEFNDARFVLMGILLNEDNFNNEMYY